ncbi:hypothetical protein ACQB6R_00045 [Propionibacteriaceae bacterium G1746]
MSTPHPASQATPTRAPQQDDVAPDEQPAGATTWQDPRRLDTDWDPPSWRDRFPLQTQLLGLLLALALFAGLVWAAGGFRRTSSLRQVDWHTPAVTGPAEITLTRAWLVYSDYGDPEILLEAMCRLVTDTAPRNQTSGVRHGIGISMGGEVIPERDQRVFFQPDSSQALGRRELSPGTPAVPCQVEATLPEGFTEQPWVRVVIREQEYRKSSFGSNDDRTWVLTRNGVVMNVPLTVRDERKK